MQYLVPETSFQPRFYSMPQVVIHCPPNHHVRVSPLMSSFHPRSHPSVHLRPIHRPPRPLMRYVESKTSLHPRLDHSPVATYFPSHHCIPLHSNIPSFVLSPYPPTVAESSPAGISTALNGPDAHPGQVIPVQDVVLHLKTNVRSADLGAPAEAWANLWISLPASARPQMTGQSTDSGGTTDRHDKELAPAMRPAAMTSEPPRELASGVPDRNRKKAKKPVRWNRNALACLRCRARKCKVRRFGAEASIEGGLTIQCSGVLQNGKCGRCIKKGVECRYISVLKRLAASTGACSDGDDPMPT